jgi:hypothetical protein
MIYAPIQIDSPGMINSTWGIGVITPLGAFITSEIPPFTRIFAKAFLPKVTTFKAKNGNIIPYVLPPNMALGIKNLTAFFKKPEPHYAAISIKLTQVIPIDFNIIIEEIDVGSFKIMPYSLSTKTITQPKNSWVFLI